MNEAGTQDPPYGHLVFSVCREPWTGEGDRVPLDLDRGAGGQTLEPWLLESQEGWE